MKIKGDKFESEDNFSTRKKCKFSNAWTENCVFEVVAAMSLVDPHNPVLL
jgi:hypothetical protein